MNESRTEATQGAGASSQYFNSIATLDGESNAESVRPTTSFQLPTTCPEGSAEGTSGGHSAEVQGMSGESCSHSADAQGMTSEVQRQMNFEEALREHRALLEVHPQGSSSQMKGVLALNTGESSRTR